MNRVVLLGILVLAVPMATAANDTSTDDAVLRGDLKSLKPGDSGLARATIVNRLGVNDTIRLTIGGPAVNTLITAEVDESPSTVRCIDPGNKECLVDVGANARNDVNITVEAISVGQSVMEGTANSTLTELASSDTLDVSVQPTYGQRFVDAPGITALHILVIALAAGIVLALRRH